VTVAPASGVPSSLETVPEISFCWAKEKRLHPSTNKKEKIEFLIIV
jgi:hypothetical protein